MEWKAVYYAIVGYRGGEQCCLPALIVFWFSEMFRKVVLFTLLTDFVGWLEMLKKLDPFW